MEKKTNESKFKLAHWKSKNISFLKIRLSLCILRSLKTCTLSYLGGTRNLCGEGGYSILHCHSEFMAMAQKVYARGLKCMYLCISLF